MQCSNGLDSASANGVWEPTTLATGPQKQASLPPRPVNTHIHTTPQQQHATGTHPHAIGEGSGVVSQRKGLLHAGKEITGLRGWSEDIGGYGYMEPASHQSPQNSARSCSCNSPYDLGAYNTFCAASPVHGFEQHGCRCDMEPVIERQSPAACRQSRAAPALPVYDDDARPPRNACCADWAPRHHVDANMYEIQVSDDRLHSSLGATRMYVMRSQHLPRRPAHRHRGYPYP
jgi:hypothetical protein